MCGRATLTNRDMSEIVEALDADVSPEDSHLFRPRYNIAPSDLHWIVRPGKAPGVTSVQNPRNARRLIVPAIWGYLPSSATRPLINVRSEQVSSGRGFRDAMQSRRCVMVTDGFLEWDKARSPFWFHRANGALVLLAGLFQPPVPGMPGARPRFTVLTTRANNVVAPAHDRMPVVIAPAAVDAWLTDEPSRVTDLLAPAPEPVLVATAVSRRVNSVKNDDSDCLTAPTMSNPRQGALF